MVNVGNLTINQFEEIVNNKQVICFCAGKAMNEFCENYPNIIKKILYIVDNTKSGTSFFIGDNEIPIIGFDKIDRNIENAILLITSIKYADEIVMQLDKIGKMSGLTVYIPLLFQNEHESLRVDSGNEIIPRIIHYCWFGKNDMPQKFKQNIDSWKRYCPNFKIILWNESNYDISKNKYMKQAYENKKWGFVPDYARLDIVNTYGGIYLDTDVEIIKPLDNLLRYKLFCGFESNEYVNFGLGFGAVHNHPVLKDMMKVYNDIEFVNNDGTLNLVASPIYQTNVLRTYGLRCNGKSQQYDNYIVFASDFFAPINPFGYGKVSENSYSIHQYAATWFDMKEQLEKSRIIKSINYIKNRMKK